VKLRITRITVLSLGLALLTSGGLPLLSRAFAAAESGPKVQLNVANSQPREMEETTTKSISREYTTAWKTLADALEHNRIDRIGASFVGTAEEQLRKQIAEQKKNGLSTRILDHGHKLDVVFYSPEGSVMQLRDTAQLERQYLEGERVVHSETVTQNYVVLMAVTGDRWKVRLLQEQ
jgi:hypothetical protein